MQDLSVLNLPTGKSDCSIFIVIVFALARPASECWLPGATTPSKPASLLRSDCAEEGGREGEREKHITHT